jgi:RNA recognition motif-containing protein
MFSPFGKVISTRVLRDPQGIGRGVGFARMDSKETCEAIIGAFNGKCLHGKSNMVLFCSVLFVPVLTVPPKYCSV